MQIGSALNPLFQRTCFLLQSFTLSPPGTLVIAPITFAIITQIALIIDTNLVGTTLGRCATGKKFFSD